MGGGSVSLQSAVLSHAFGFNTKLYSSASVAAIVAGNGGGMLMNIALGSYYTGNIPFLNWWYVASQIQIFSAISGNNGLSGQAAWNALGASGFPYFNPNTGDLNNPVQSDLTSIARLFFTPPTFEGSYPGTPWWYGQIFKATWNGTATAGIGPSQLGAGGSFSSTSNSATFTIGTGGSISNVYLYLTITDRNNPPTGIKVWLSPQHDTHIANGEYLNPDWVNIVGKFGVLRWMGWMQTNFSSLSDYSQLADFNYNALGAQLGGGIVASLPGTNGAFGPKASLHPSIFTYIANWTQSHPYFNIPYCANSTFMPQVASYFLANLNNGLVTRYEFGNEPWNFTAELTASFCNLQPWPPLGASAPFQVAPVISSIQAQATPTVTTAAPHGLSNGAFVVFFITSGTMAPTLNNTGWTITVTGASTFTINANTTGETFGAGTVATAGQEGNAYGYLAAQFMQQVYSTYGAVNRKKWRGQIGVQTVTGDVSSKIFTGIQFYLANSAPVGTVFANLFDDIVCAPYTGNSTLAGSVITSLTKAATPTVTVAGSNPFVNGQTIRLYATTGMTQINNMTATVSGVSGLTFNININTSTFSSWVEGNGNFCIDNTLPLMVDTSVSLNSSTPATYPTKYSYFAQEISDSIINGTSTNAGYVTNGNYNLTTSGLQAALIQIALVADEWGISLNEYEGGNTFAYTFNDNTGFSTVSAIPSLMDFIYNWKYDAGTATYGPANVWSALFAATNAAGIGWPALTVDGGGGNGPFEGMRFYPGDQGNPYFAPLVIRNEGGPYVVSTTLATWSLGPYSTSTNHRFSNSSLAPPYQDSLNANVGSGATTVMVLVTTNGGSIVSVTCGGVSLALAVSQDASGSLGTSAIFYGQIAAGNSGQVIVTYTSGASFNFRNVFVLTVNGLASTSPIGTYGGPGNGVTLASPPYTANQLIVTVGTVLGTVSATCYSSTSGASTPSAASPVTTSPLMDTGPGVASQEAVMATFTAPFSSPLFFLNQGNPGGLVAATFK